MQAKAAERPSLLPLEALSNRVCVTDDGPATWPARVLQQMGQDAPLTRAGPAVGMTNEPCGFDTLRFEDVFPAESILS